MFSHECPRQMKDCTPLDNVCSDQLSTSGTALTFICCGSSDPNTRSVESDKYRLCFKYLGTDQITDNDELDLLDLCSVITRGMSVQLRKDTESKFRSKHKNKKSQRSRLG